MKRCPKCNRSFPDDNQKFCTFDGGLLVAPDKAFDPNATIQSSTPRRDPEPVNKPAAPPHDWSETIALDESVEAPTAVLPRQTGPTGSPTAGNLRPPAGVVAPAPSLPPSQSAPVAEARPAAKDVGGVPSPAVAAPPGIVPSTPATSAAAAPVIAGAPPKKRSKLPLILGILALLLVFGATALAAGVYYFLIKPRREATQSAQPVIVTKDESENLNSNANTSVEPAKPETEKAAPPAFVAPPNTTRFENSAANLDGKLAEHYLDFSFYYPDNWVTDPKAGVAGANNFVKVERRLPEMTQESFAVGWYSSKGTFAADESTFPQLVDVLGATLAKSFPGYLKVSEGPTKVNSLDGYEFRFESSAPGSQDGALKLWGRVIFLPAGTAGENGATLLMLATSRAPELSGVEDVGEKGQMPVILESFRFGRSE
jgi:hypothetical protein